MTANVRVELSPGNVAHSDAALAGVITNATSVVAKVKGSITTENVVKEFYTADSVNPSNITGVDARGVGMDATKTCGAEYSYGREHLTTFD